MQTLGYVVPDYVQDDYVEAGLIVSLSVAEAEELRKQMVTIGNFGVDAVILATEVLAFWKQKLSASPEKIHL
ncbi:hypothetical protein [Caballeronia arvi]|uniref:hypothetical protein n=1 Tax=Caballeronia arvi TaxID=1777135 RepID=UPI00117CEE3D|nr:hypothetical protein [Caballeronia arvi]